jgi:Mlc titration factor MtfA (ptsG expression regulator)
MWKGLRRKKLQAAPFPSEWRQIIETHCPYYLRLPDADRHELERHVQVFLAEKKFEGCGGLTISDEHKVCVAAFACLLLLHRDTDYYPSLQTILVYPSTYVVPTTRHVGSGVMEEGQEARAGESWQEGAVVVAWDAACSAIESPGSGYNVVLHEFAHQLDYEDGQTNGAPQLGHHESRQVRQRRYADWSRVMKAEYEHLRGQVQRGETTILRDYGATNPAEFFAVATECFFGRPQELRQQHPELYAEMKWYYQQDPAIWLAVQSQN